MEISVRPGGQWDVVVCGGGTAGSIAAIAAARRGARTLLLERSFSVGGMLTIGDAGITKFIEHCRDVEVYKREVLDALATDPRGVQVVGGIAREYVDRMIHSGGALGTHGQAGSYVFTDRYAAQWTLMDMLDEAGVVVLYDTVVCAAEVSEGVLEAVIAHDKGGFVRYRAARFIDATGDADVAALSGVAFHHGVSEDDLREGCGTSLHQMMSFGTMFRVRGVDMEALLDFMDAHPDRFWEHEFGVMSPANVRESFRAGQMCVFRVMVELPGGQLRPMQVYNTPAPDEVILLGPYCGTEGDGLDVSSLSKGQKVLHDGVRKLMGLIHNQIPGFENARVVFVPDVGVRETRHIVGEYVLTGLDVLTGRDFPDSVACGGHPIDVKPLPPEVEHASLNHWRFHIPYRVMVPQSVDNLLVAGRSASATRMASGSVRVTTSCMALGEAAGVACALSIAQSVPPRALEAQVLRDALMKQGAVL